MPEPRPQGHLLIGPPGSGKSTLAAILAPLLPARVIANDVLRDNCGELRMRKALGLNWNRICMAPSTAPLPMATTCWWMQPMRNSTGAKG